MAKTYKIEISEEQRQLFQTIMTDIRFNREHFLTTPEEEECATIADLLEVLPSDEAGSVVPSIHSFVRDGESDLD